MTFYIAESYQWYLNEMEKPIVVEQNYQENCMLDTVYI
jgi:hypothetical protein